MSTKKQETKQNSAETKEQKPAEERQQLPTSVTARAYPTAGGGPVLAGLTFDINGVLAIRGAKLVEGKNGPFVSFPQRQTKDGYQEQVFPITKEMRELMNSTAVSAYKLAMSEMTERMERTQQAQQAAPAQATGPVMSM